MDLFIAGLLSHATVEDAAAAAKISASTGWRYLRDPAVPSGMREASRSTMNQAKVLLQAASVEAVACLRKIMREAENESVQVSAAKTILEMGLRAIELDDIEERLDKLEQIAKSRNWKESGAEQSLAASVNRGVNGHA
jgi:hypothetical protein